MNLIQYFTMNITNSFYLMIPQDPIIFRTYLFLQFYPKILIHQNFTPLLTILIQLTFTYFNFG